MKVVFYSAGKAREDMLARALEQGVRALNDDFELRYSFEFGEDKAGNELKYPGPTPDTDVAVAFGVKGRARIVLEDHWIVGKSTLFFDKGYSRHKGEGGHTEYSRISVNAPSPADYMMEGKRPPDRFAKLNIKFERHKKGEGGHVLVCGSSPKYHAFHRIGTPAEYSTKVIKRLLKITQRHIVYRPKPSDEDGDDAYDDILRALAADGVKHLAGASYSHGDQSILQALRGAHALVTHGSAAAMDAIVQGVPAFVLGKGIASPVACDDLERMEEPPFPSNDERFRWACAMAYCQWTTAELRSGEAWTHLKREVERQRKMPKPLGGLEPVAREIKTK